MWHYVRCRPGRKQNGLPMGVRRRQPDNHDPVILGGSSRAIRHLSDERGETITGWKPPHVSCILHHCNIWMISHCVPYLAIRVIALRAGKQRHGGLREEGVVHNHGCSRSNAPPELLGWLTGKTQKHWLGIGGIQVLSTIEGVH